MREVAIKFTVELLEDMHTGTGMSQLGVVDSTHARDPDGFPVVWFSTWRGLLREAGEDYLRSLALVNEPSIGAKREFLYELLGTPVNSQRRNQRDQGACFVSSLRFVASDEDRNYSRQSEKFINRTSTARQVFSRRPEESTLRTIELSTTGSRFTGQLRIALAGEDECSTAAEVDRVNFICECLQRITHIGSRKQRDQGRIHLDVQSTDFLNVSGDEKVFVVDTPESTTQPVVVRVLLRNLEPLLLTSNAVVQNLNSCLSFIPGQTLRGAFIKWIWDRHEETVPDRFASQSVLSFGNAYVVPPGIVKQLFSSDDSESNQPSQLAKLEVIPLPMTLHAPKRATSAASSHSKLPWWAVSSKSSLLGARGEIDVLYNATLSASCESDKSSDSGSSSIVDRSPKKRIKSEEYLGRIGDSSWQRVKPKRGVMLRNRIPTKRIDPTERMATELGETDQEGSQSDALFSDEVLVPDQHFAAELRFNNKESAEEFASIIKGLRTDQEESSWLRVGRGGRPVAIVAVCVTDRHVQATPNDLFVTLTSDLIARDSQLGFCSDLSIEDITRLVAENSGTDFASHTADINRLLRVAKPVTEKLNEPPRVEETVGTRIVLGFNQTSRLPRSPATAIQKGSTFWIKAKDTAASDDSSDVATCLNVLRKELQRIATNRDGLGERLADGFGRFAVDLNIHHQPLRVEDSAAEVTRFRPVRWQDRVHRQVERFIKQVNGKNKELLATVSVSQLHWLRYVVEKWKHAADIDKTWEALDKRKSGQKWSPLRRKIDEWLKTEDFKTLIPTEMSPNSVDEIRAKQYFVARLAFHLILTRRQDSDENSSSDSGSSSAAEASHD